MSKFLSFFYLVSSLRSSTQLLYNHQSTKRIIGHSLSSLGEGGVSISDAFDGGNIEFVGTEKKSVKDDDLTSTIVRLKIKKDPYTELERTYHYQYFSFRSHTTDNKKVKYIIENAGDTSYSKAWEEATVFFSRTINDPNSWKRQLDTSYDENGNISWTQKGSGYFCYFPPYSYSRHLDLIDKCNAAASITTTMSLGKTLDDRDIDCVKVGQGDKICWIIHRQHPGESMAEYFAEGLIERLLRVGRSSVDDDDDELIITKQALEKYTFYIVPNMCIDGSVRGHLRTNAKGHNLNREWAASSSSKNSNYEAPTLERSPEVYYVLQKMDETGVDAFLDIHGDEVLPFNFLAGGEGLPNWYPRLQSLHGAFLASYERANSDMQRIHGYEPEPPNDAALNICSNQIGYRFDCFSATLEMPFNDCRTNPDPKQGWSPARAKRLGASILHPLLYIYPYLRDQTDFWNHLPKEDDYVCPTPNYK